MAEPICSAVSSCQQSVDIVRVDVSAFVLVCVGACIHVYRCVCMHMCVCLLYKWAYTNVAMCMIKFTLWNTHRNIYIYPSYKVEQDLQYASNYTWGSIRCSSISSTQHATHSLCMQCYISTWYMEVWPVGSSVKSTCCLSLPITLGEGCLLTSCDNSLCTCTGTEEVVFC